MVLGILPVGAVFVSPTDASTTGPGISANVEVAPGSVEPGALIADWYVAPDGSIKAGGAILLSRGKITAINGTGDAPGASGVVHRDGAVVCPGLIDVRSSAGAHDNNVESAYSIDPGASAIDAVDWSHRDFQSAIESGITTVLIAPAGANLICGTAVVAKTASADRRPVVLRRDGPLMFALGTRVWNIDRAPTSRVGSIAMLRDALDDARGGHGHERLIAFARGEWDGIVVAEEAIDARAALRLFSPVSRPISLVYTDDADDFTVGSGDWGGTVVLGPYTFDMPPRTLAGAAALSAKGIPLAFAAEAPEHAPDALRTTAALAVRYGLDPATARAAMTSSASQVAGVADRVGAIKPGLDADLVVFSGDPLRLDTRVVEVYVGGVRVYHNPDRPKSSGSDSSNGEER